MKKILCLLMVMALAFAVFSGCGNSSDNSDTKQSVNDKNKDNNEIGNVDFDSELYDYLELSEAHGVDFTSFSAKDTDGNLIDERIFKDYDITLVNCWTTWCPYCIEEMPYLNELYNDLPDNVNLISLCNDAYEMPEDFDNIMDEFSHDFTTIPATSSLNDEIGADYITGFPSTFFVNSKGEVVGCIAGVPLASNARGVDESVIGGYKKLINDALEIAG